MLQGRLATVLKQLADQEMRHPRDQAVVLIRDALRAAGQLPETQTETAHIRGTVAEGNKRGERG